jgi:hypothetical protein
MTYKEFKSWCDKRVCDGLWSFDTATKCINIIEEVESIKVKFLGFTLKKQTEEKREAAWQSISDRINNM